MITPVDIQNKVFKQEFRGYSRQEVDIFLNEIIDSYEKIYTENINAREKIRILEESTVQHKKTSEALQSALLVAHNVSEEMKVKAKAEADAIVSEAEQTKKRLLSQTENEAQSIISDYNLIKNNIDNFKDIFKKVFIAQKVMQEKAKETNNALNELFAALDSVAETPVAEQKFAQFNEPAPEPEPIQISISMPELQLFPDLEIDPEDDFQINLANILEPIEDEPIAATPPEPTEMTQQEQAEVIKKILTTTTPMQEEDTMDLEKLILSIKNKNKE